MASGPDDAENENGGGQKKRQQKNNKNKKKKKKKMKKMKKKEEEEEEEAGPSPIRHRFVLFSRGTNERDANQSRSEANRYGLPKAI